MAAAPAEFHSVDAILEVRCSWSRLGRLNRGSMQEHVPADKLAKVLFDGFPGKVGEQTLKR